MRLSDYTTVKPDRLVIGSRGSRLAMWQAQHVRNILEKKGLAAEILEIKTTGDRIQDRFLHEIGGKGVFVREVEQALLEKKADLAVHSLKDLPAETPEPFLLSGILPRHKEGDVLILNPGSRHFPSRSREISAKDLREAGDLTIATGSLRRGSLLKEASSRVQVIPVRGNVDTRIRKLKDSDWDGLILAEASLERLPGLCEGLRVLRLEAGWFVPSPSQGALVLETLKDHPLNPLLAEVSCEKTRQHVSLERSVLKALGGDCTMPVGIHATTDTNGVLSIRAVVATRGGKSARTDLRYSGEKLPTQGGIVRQVLDGLLLDGLDAVMKELKLTLPEREG